MGSDDRRMTRRACLVGLGSMGALGGCNATGDGDDERTAAPASTRTHTPTSTTAPPPEWDSEEPLAPRYDVSERESIYRETPEAELHLVGSVPDGEGPFPLVVYVHGGAWQYGGPWFAGAELFARSGIAVAGLEYRLAETATYPAAVRDVVAGVRWLHANADVVNVDPERFALMGGSAGAHLSALVAAAPDHPTFQPRDFDVDASATVDAVIPHYGAFELTRMAGCDRPAIAAFFGEDCSSDAVLAEASPITHVDESHPPTQLFHGTEDPVLDVQQARDYRDALEEAGVPVEYHELEGVGHGYVTPDEEENEAVRDRVHREMVRYLFETVWGDK